MPRSRQGARTCTACGLTQTVRADGICQKCTTAANPDAIRGRTCGVCGKSTVSKVGTHPECRVFKMEEDVDVHDLSLALPDGNWRFDPFRRVQIFVPDNPEDMEPPTDEVTIKREAQELAPEFEEFAATALRHPCDHCGVDVGTHCITSQGGRYARGSHRVRNVAVVAAMRATGRPVERKYLTGRDNPLPEIRGRQFTDDECRDGHARYRQGDRDPVTVAQQREYDRVLTFARRERKLREVAA